MKPEPAQPRIQSKGSAGLFQELMIGVTGMNRKVAANRRPRPQVPVGPRGEAWREHFLGYAVDMLDM